jgi:hypothetical protein
MKRNHISVRKQEKKKKVESNGKQHKCLLILIRIFSSHFASAQQLADLLGLRISRWQMCI